MGIEAVDNACSDSPCCCPTPGTKFLLISSPWHANPQLALQRAYEAYADQVMKNPFYTPEMPIRVEGFDRAVEKLVKG